MARANVKVIIDDQSYVIPSSESGSSVRGGMPSIGGLIGAVGYTAERKSGIMTIEDISDWMHRLTAKDPIETAADGANHVGNLVGGTGSRWPAGPTGSWKNEWWAAHNYLQYGGILIVGGTGSEQHTSDGYTTLKDKAIPLDVVFAATGDEAGAIQTQVGGIGSYRQDVVAVLPDRMAGGDQGNITSVVAEGNADEFNITVFGAKRHLDVTRGTNESSDPDFVVSSCAADVAGCIARNDKLRDPWWSPAGFRRGQILDVVNLVYNPNDSEQDTLYEAKVNPIVTFPGEGTVLFGDKTGADATSTLSRINISRLFIYLKKTIGAAARSKLFEMNDSATRASFVNAVTPFLRNIQAGRGLYDFRVVCDTSNNPAALVDANQFNADIFIKPTKSINFIRITFTNKNTADDMA
ncbi:MAG: hypothetical protein CMB80_02585 [Flammeovirgaceae bacterium]|nr:hypothetical protein [Flammeovirgaceae bacterium]